MGKRVIVYAEDDDAVRKAMVWNLELDYDDIRQCANGKEALETLRELNKAGTPALLLTDYNMPEMDGLQLVKALKDESIRVPTILLSANLKIDEAIEAAGVADNLDMVIEKPARDIEKAIESLSARYDRLQPKSLGEHAKKPSDDDGTPPLP